MSTFETTRNELRMPKKSCAQNSNYKQFLTCVRCDAMLETGKQKSCDGMQNASQKYAEIRSI